MNNLTVPMVPPPGAPVNPKLIEEKWNEMDRILVKNGVLAPQRRVMAQAFYGGAYAAADILRDTFNEAETPEGFVGVLSTMMEELQTIKANGLPPVSDESGPDGPEEEGGSNLIVLP